jgi:hypothetical protein
MTVSPSHNRRTANGDQQTRRRQCTKGAVKKRSQLKTKVMGETKWTKRSRKGVNGGQFMAQKDGKKFKGVSREGVA